MYIHTGGQWVDTYCMKHIIWCLDARKSPIFINLKLSVRRCSLLKYRVQYWHIAIISNLQNRLLNQSREGTLRWIQISFWNNYVVWFHQNHWDLQVMIQLITEEKQFSQHMLSSYHIICSMLICCYWLCQHFWPCFLNDLDPFATIGWFSNEWAVGFGAGGSLHYRR